MNIKLTLLLVMVSVSSAFQILSVNRCAGSPNEFVCLAGLSDRNAEEEAKLSRMWSAW